MNGRSTISPANDDTIELQLTPEQFLELSQAAGMAEPVAPTQISAVGAPGRKSPAFASSQPLFKVSPASHVRRWHHTPIVKMAGAIIAYVALAWWSASQLAGESRPPTTAAARPTVVIPRPALLTSSPKATVRVMNPFDATEVFEFPAGTSDAEGREKVAQILLQRARKRQSQWERLKPVVSMRTASLYHSP